MSIGRLQKQDVKTVDDVEDKSNLINDSQIYLSALGNDKTLAEALADGDIGSTNASNLQGHPASDFVLQTEYENADVLAKIKTVDGPDSGLDADLLDGKHASDFRLVSDAIDADTLDSKQASAFVLQTEFSDAALLAKLKNVDGPSSELDADKLDGKHASDFATKEFAPLEILCGNPPNSRLYLVGNVSLQSSGLSKVFPASPNAFGTFVDSWIDFQTRTTGGGSIFCSFPSTTVGKFRRAALAFKPNATIEVVFSAPYDVVALLPDAGSLVSSGNTPIGFIDLESTDSLGKFKTAGSATNIIEMAVGGVSRVFQTTSSGATSSGGGGGGLSNGAIPLGGIVATFPHLPGAYVCTALETPDSNGFVKCNGQQVLFAGGMNGATIPNLNDSAFLMGYSTSGESGGANSKAILAANLPSHAHSMAHSHNGVISLVGGTATIAGGSHTHTGSFTAELSGSHDHGGYSATQNAFHSHTFTSGVQSNKHVHYGTAYLAGAHTHDVSLHTIATSGVMGPNFSSFQSSINSSTISGIARSGGDHYHEVGVTQETSDHNHSGSTSAESSAHFHVIPSQEGHSHVVSGSVNASDHSHSFDWTHAHTIVIDSTSGDTSSVGSGESFDVRPKYISCVYLMRVQ